jgi:hypothetical protein
MTYLTIRAVVRKGKVEFLDEIDLPEDTSLLVTVLDDNIMAGYSLGDHLIASLQDILAGQYVETSSEEELANHLDRLFSNS